MKNLSARIRKLIAQALNDYSMIQEGDRVLVGVSGGLKYTLYTSHN